MKHSQEILRNYIRQTLSEALRANTPINWGPLYNFLKSIFSERYEDAADGFMFMGTDEPEGGPLLYLYKHGVTRRYLALDAEGNPYSTQEEGVVKISTEEAYDNIYKDIYKFVNLGKNTDSEITKEPWFVKYSEWKNLRDKTLSDAGYKVITVKEPEDIDAHKDQLDLEELNIASLVGMSKSQRGDRIKKSAAISEISKASLSTLFSETKDNYKQTVLDALERFKQQAPNFASLFPNMFREDQGVKVTVLDMPDGRRARGVIPAEFYFFINPLTGVFDKKGGKSFLEDMIYNF